MGRVGRRSTRRPYGQFLGVDGCRAGWITVGEQKDGQLGYDITTSFNEILARHRRALILVDVPIGLRDCGKDERLCDRQARRLLKKRASSVFPAPVRAALYATDYRAASRMNRERTDGRRGLSRQSWAITPKIREVNERLAGNTLLPAVREMHPELCFWALNGSEPLKYNKRSDEGYRERLTLLHLHRPDCGRVVDSVLTEQPRSAVRRDDVVDALVGWLMAWLSRGDLRTLPEVPEHDSTGLPMEMVYSLPQQQALD